MVVRRRRVARVPIELLGVVFLVGLGCSPEGETSERRAGSGSASGSRPTDVDVTDTTRAATEPTQTPAKPAGPCEIVERRTLAAGLDPDTSAVALSMSREGGLVLARSSDRLVAFPLDSEGRLDSERVDIERSPLGQLLALRTIDEGHLLLEQTPCSPIAEACLTVTLFDRKGRARARSERVPLAGGLHSLRVATTKRQLLVAHAPRASVPTLSRFELRGAPENATLEHRSFDLNPRPRHLKRSTKTRSKLGAEATPVDRPQAEIMALVADARHWAVLWRTGPVEDMRTKIVMTYGSPASTKVERRLLDHHAHGASIGERQVREIDGHGGPAGGAPAARAGSALSGLDHILVVESIAIEGEGLTFIGSFEFSAPAQFRLRWDGTVVEARPVGSGLHPDAPAPILRERLRATVEAGSDGVSLRLRGPAGYPRGKPLLVSAPAATTDAFADVARANDGFFVVYCAERSLVGVSIRCRPFAP